MTNNKSKKKNRETTTVSQILSILLKKANINESELARQTKLPQTTISRLILGETADPRISTLIPLAKFFNVSLEQILGEEALNLPQKPGPSAFNIPLLTWEQVFPWSKKQAFETKKPLRWISTERELGENSFAILAKSFMEPQFKRNSLLIVDSSLPLDDGHYSVICLDGHSLTVRQVISDEDSIYLRHLDSSVPTLILEKHHQSFGIIVESRMSLLTSF